MLTVTWDSSESQSAVDAAEFNVSFTTFRMRERVLGAVAAGRNPEIADAEREAHMRGVMHGVILVAPDVGGGLEQAMGDVEEVVGSGRRLRSIVQVRAYLNRRLVGEEDSVEEGGVDMGVAAQDSGVEEPPRGALVAPRVQLLGSEGAEVTVMVAAHVVDTCA